MFEHSDMLLPDADSKLSQYGLHDYYTTNHESNFEFYDDEADSSTPSLLSADFPDDFNEFNEALLTKLIDEFNQDPSPNPNYFNDISIDDFTESDSVSLPVDFDYVEVPLNNRKRKCVNFLYDQPNKIHKIQHEKRESNSNAAFRYRQKQKKNKSNLEDELNKSAFEMVNAKTEMLEMRKKLNTIKNIVKDLLRDKGVLGSNSVL